MYVHVLIGDRERRRPVPEVGVPDEPQLFEQVQRAVHGRDVHPDCFELDRGQDLMTNLRDRLQDELTLRRQPVALGAQLGLQQWHSVLFLGPGGHGVAARLSAQAP